MREFIVFIMFCCVFTGCTSINNLERNEVHGMVYDNQNRPVSNYKVTLNGNHSGMSDFGGRFTIKNVKNKLYTVKGEKEGYENVEDEIEVSWQKILYIQVRTREEMYEEILTKMSEENWADAENLCNHYLSSYQGDANVWFFKSVAEYKMNKKENAKASLKKSEKHGSSTWTHKMKTIMGADAKGGEYHES